nr:MAG TPA: hypothetical protein [Caudoviricetes sp.]
MSKSFFFFCLYSINFNCSTFSFNFYCFINNVVLVFHNKLLIPFIVRQLLNIVYKPYFL